MSSLAGATGSADTGSTDSDAELQALELFEQVGLKTCGNALALPAGSNSNSSSSSSAC
jgi:hypothetical protein